MQIGDVIFVRSNSPISKLIQKFDGEFSHVCVAVSESKIIESQRFVGTRVVDFYFSDYEIINLKLTDEEQFDVLKIAIELTQSHRYDYLKFIGHGIEKLFGFNKRNFWNDKDKFICSELVDIILFAIGVISYDQRLADRTPNEIYQVLKKLGY